jgi:hypothetical protein
MIILQTFHPSGILVFSTPKEWNVCNFNILNFWSAVGATYNNSDLSYDTKSPNIGIVLITEQQGF